MVSKIATERIQRQTAAMERLQQKTFMAWYGQVILKREKESPGQPISMNDDHKLLAQAFCAGWLNAMAFGKAHY